MQATMKETRRVHVKDAAGNPVSKLNELEWIPGDVAGEGTVLANIWYEDVVVVINAKTGVSAPVV
jgi:glutamine cyclotransferase